MAKPGRKPIEGLDEIKTKISQRLNRIMRAYGVTVADLTLAIYGQTSAENHNAYAVVWRAVKDPVKSGTGVLLDCENAVRKIAKKKLKEQQVVNKLYGLEFDAKK